MSLRLTTVHENNLSPTAARFPLSPQTGRGLEDLNDWPSLGGEGGERRESGEGLLPLFSGQRRNSPFIFSETHRCLAPLRMPIRLFQ